MAGRRQADTPPEQPGDRTTFGAREAPFPVTRRLQSATDTAVAWTAAAWTWTVALTLFPAGLGCAVCVAPGAQLWRDAHEAWADEDGAA